MAIKSCKNCGLAVENHVDSVECLKFGKKEVSKDTGKNCTYYIDIRYEDEEALTPLQHLLLKDQELKARKMKVVI